MQVKRVHACNACAAHTSLLKRRYEDIEGTLAKLHHGLRSLTRSERSSALLTAASFMNERQTDLSNIK